MDVVVVQQPARSNSQAGGSNPPPATIIIMNPRVTDSSQISIECSNRWIFIAIIKGELRLMAMDKNDPRHLSKLQQFNIATEANFDKLWEFVIECTRME